MAKDYSEFVVILDRSGSMQSAKSDHEGGLRSFVNDQKELSGDIRFTLIQFDCSDPCEIIYDGVPIGDVKEISLVPRGGTPLLDAIGKATAHVEGRLKGRSPDQVIVMVITDGQENSSHEWTRERVKARIADLERTGWKFLYLGANVDAFSEAGVLGITRGAAMNYANNAAGSAGMYRALSAANRRSHDNRMAARAAGVSYTSADCAADYTFTDDERAASAGNATPKKEGDQWRSI